MDKLKIDLESLMLLALVVKSIISNGSLPLSLAIGALVAHQAYKAFLNKKDEKKKDLNEEELKILKERIGSLESKQALTMGTNRKF